MAYSNLIGSQNELSSNLANENFNIENANMEAKAVFQKKQKDLSDNIIKLQGKVSSEGGKNEIVDGIPISEDDVAGIMGGKATYNMGKNIANMSKNGLTSASDIATKISKVPTSFKLSSKIAPALSPSDIGLGDQEARLTTALKGAFKPPVAVSKAVTAVKSGESAASSLVPVLKEGESTVASTASDLIGKAGAGLSIASGLELGSKDLTGLSEGKGWVM